MKARETRYRSVVGLSVLMLAIAVTCVAGFIDSRSYAAESSPDAKAKGSPEEAKEEANRGLYKASDPVNEQGFDVMTTDAPGGKTLEVESATASPTRPQDFGKVTWDGKKTNPTKFRGRSTGWGAKYDVRGIYSVGGGEGGVGGPEGGGGDPEEWFSHFDADPDDPRIRLEINGGGDDDNTVLLGNNADALKVTIVDGGEEDGNPIEYTVLLSCQGREGEEGDVTFDGENDTLNVTLTDSVTVDLTGTVTGKMKINGHCSEAADHSVDGEVAGDAMVTKVTFTGAATEFKTVRKDDNTANYPTPHWQKGRTVQSPACYVKDTAMEVDVVLSAPTLSNGDIWVKGTADGVEGGIAFTSKKGQINNGVATVNNIVAATNLPDSIYCFDPMTISWEYSTDETNWYPAGSSVNQVYVTLGESQTTVYHTLVHIGCKGANTDNITTDEKMVEFVWSKFEDRYVLRVDGTLMKYYGDWMTNNSDTNELLADADGQCDAWARLFLDVLKSQGHTEGDNFYRLRSTQAPTIGLLVDDWYIDTSNDNLASMDPDKRLESSTFNWFVEFSTDLRGVPGQGTANPLSLFAYHAYIKVNGVYYDPSYGKVWETDEGPLYKTVRRVVRKTVDTRSEEMDQIDYNYNGKIWGFENVWKYEFSKVITPSEAGNCIHVKKLSY